MSDSKKRCEVGPDPLHNFNNALKRWHDEQWARLTPEDYIKGNAVIQVHYVFWRGGEASCDHCAVVYLHHRNLGVELDLLPVDHLMGEPPFVQDGNARQEKLVLVDIVEVMKEHEGVLVPAPSVVEGLYPLQHCESLFPYQILDLELWTIEGSGVLDDREIDAGFVFDVTAGIALDGESPIEVVKSRPCVVKAVADDSGPLDKWRGVADMKPEYKLPLLSIYFFGDGIRFSVSNVRSNSHLKGIKVFLCPRDLGMKPLWEISDPTAPLSDVP